MQGTETRFTRRHFLSATTALVAGSALAACGAPAAPTATPTGAAGSATATPAPAAASPTPAATPTSAAAAAATSTTAGTPTTVGQTASVCTVDWQPTLPAFPKYTPPLQITTYLFGSGTSRRPGPGLPPAPPTQRILDTLGIEYVAAWESPPGGPWAQKLMASIAANSLPEVVPMFVDPRSGGFVGRDVLADMIDQGAVAEIRGIFEATASDLTKQKKTYPAGPMWAGLWRGETLFGIAWTNGPAYNSDMLGWIRQDLLDKVNLKVPETLDELTEVLRAFKKSKLTAFGIAANQDLISWKLSLDPIFGAFGVMPTIWRRWTGGEQLEYGSIQPEVKEALKVIRGWYAEGLIDPDYYTAGPGPSWQQVAQGKVGVFFGPWWTAGGLYNAGGLLSQHPDWKFVNMPLPKGPGGQQGRMSPNLAMANVFRKGVEEKKIEAGIRHLNWQMELHVNWLKYQQYGENRNSQTFVEGYDWQWGANCTVELVPGDSPLRKKYADPGPNPFGFPEVCYPDYQIDIDREMGKWLTADPGTLNKAQQGLLGPSFGRKVEVLVYQRTYDVGKLSLADEFVGAPTARMVKVLPDLQKLEQQYFTEIVTGKRSVEDFDAFVKEWKSRGGDQVTADVNAWYKEHKRS